MSKLEVQIIIMSMQILAKAVDMLLSTCFYFSTNTKCFLLSYLYLYDVDNYQRKQYKLYFIFLIRYRKKEGFQLNGKVQFDHLQKQG